MADLKDAIEGIKKTIEDAVASGDLIPRADAQAAVALVVSELRQFVTDSYQCGCMDAGCAGRHAERNSTLEALSETLDALAPADGLAAVEALRDRAEKAEQERDAAVRGRNDWRDDFKALAAAIVGDTGLSAMTVAAQARTFRPRAEKAEADRDRLAAANVALEAKVAGLREAVDEQTKARAQHWLRRTMTAPEDAEVEALCERCGYGAVMDAASRLWARKPHGSGAFYIGGCIGFKSDEEARAALATQEAGT